MEVKQSLLAAMQEVISDLGVLVVDECEYVDAYKGRKWPDDPQRTKFTPITDRTGCQQRVILLASAYHCPIFFIRFDPSHPIGAQCYNTSVALHTRWSITKKSLRALLPTQTIVINKHNPNAFIDTDLYQQLQNTNQGAGVNNLVIIGWQSNACVPETVGIPVDSCKHYKQGPGAIAHGYTVMTCQDVLNGTDARWTKASEKIKFYTHL